MSEMKHTPGPWGIHRGDDYLKVFAGKDDELTILLTQYPDDADLADAKLIAAAPDMVEALKLITDHLMKERWLIMVEGKDAIGRARAALAKAGVK